MEYFVDTADLEKVKKLAKWLPLEGITVNPSIVAKEGRELLPLVEEMLGYCSGIIHAQVLKSDPEGIKQEAKKLSEMNSERIFVKIPVTKTGLQAIKELDTDRINITATAVFGVSQALTAAKAGAKYIAPYVSRWDREIAQSGVGLVKEIYNIINNYNSDAKVIAASVKNSKQIKELMELGIGAITMPPEIYIQAHNHNLTEKAVEIFEEDWEKEFVNLSITASKKS